jgi:predicted nuclease of predicted toxin-antitoxin system
MKLLFDANLSHKLVTLLADVFPESSHVRTLGLKTQDDSAIWESAKQGGFTIVTLDSDFYDLSCYYGQPPRVIWLRCGNQPTPVHERILRQHLDLIGRFASDPDAGCLELT